MPKDKVTIQDIADAVGVSRNTASKALNGNESIPEATRNKIVKKAAELKYKQFAFVDTDAFARKSGNIALFTANMPTNSHFGSLLLSGLEKKISAEGFNLSFHIVRDSDTASLTLPNNFEPGKADGVVCIEMFDKAYSEMICSLGIPVIFIDASSEILFSELQADVILMENEHSVYSIASRLIASGHSRLGFVGDYNHCKSFNERWTGFNRALADAGLPLDRSACIVENDRHFGEARWIEDQLDRMERLPSAFVCANDFIAVGLLRALKNKNIRIPEDVLVVGFDDAQESRIVEPQLTTVHIYNTDMGIVTAEMLLSRIHNPAKPFMVTHVKTDPIYRESTGSLQRNDAAAALR